MLLLLSALLFSHPRPSFAVPLVTLAANLTASSNEVAPPWVDNPSGRGTWGLLYSCLFTLLLCVYIAIHLNVPPQEDTTFKFWLRKTKWVVIAIFAPEIVVYIAFEQWFLARKFLLQLTRIASESTEEKFKYWNQKNGKASQFDMVYAYYVVMGGFAGITTDIHNSLERVTFTPEGILFLATHGQFCQLSRSEIEDKSKADILAKGLVCIQVLWLAGQALERKVTGYPVTLLEVHTIVHVFCALIMYCLWFQKPLNVQNPTIITFDEDNHLLALLLQLSAKTKNKDNDFSSLLHSTSQYTGFKAKEMSGSLWEIDEPEFWWYNSPRPLHREVGSTDGLTIIQPAHQRPQEHLHLQTFYSYTISSDVEGLKKHYPIGGINKIYESTSTDKTCCRIFSGQALFSGMGPAFPHRRRNGHSPSYNLVPALGEFIDVVSLSAKDVKRLEFVGKAIKRIFDETAPESVENLGLNLRTPFISLPDLYNWKDPPLSLRSFNFTGDVFSFLSKNSLYVCAAMVLIPTAYGSVHLAALNVIFPSAIERLLWKISCYYLVGAASLLALVLFLTYANSTIHSAWTRFLKNSKKDNPNGYGSSVPRSPGPFIRYLVARKYVKSFETGALLSGIGSTYRIRSPANYVFHFISKPFFLLPEFLKAILALVSAWLLFFILGAAVIVYLGARLYIVFESFISLRHVPIGVYQTPELNIFGNIPHL